MGTHQQRSKKYSGVYWTVPYSKRTGRTFWIDYTTTVNNRTKRKRERIGTEAEGVSEAVAFRVRQTRMVNERLGPDTPQELKRAYPTLDKAADMRWRWMAQKGKATIRNEVRLYNKSIKDQLGYLRVDQITHNDVDMLHTRLLAYRKTNGDPYAPKTIAEIIGLVTRIYRWMIRHERYPLGDPTQGVELGDIDNHVTEVLTPDDVQRLFEALDKWPDQAFANMIRFAYYTGFRRGEICNLKWKDIDRNYIVGLPNKQTGKVEAAPLSRKAIEVIQDQDQNYRHGPYVFPTWQGKRRKEMKQWYTFRKTCGLEWFRFHGFRHNYGSQLADDPDVPPYAIQRLMRHRSMNTTQRYLDMTTDKLRQYADRFGGDENAKSK